MRPMFLALATLLALLGGAAGVEAETAARPESDCTEYCALKAVERCDDVTSTWCNAYIVGCLAGCGISHL